MHVTDAPAPLPPAQASQPRQTCCLTHSSSMDLGAGKGSAWHARYDTVPWPVAVGNSLFPDSPSLDPPALHPTELFPVVQWRGAWMQYGCIRHVCRRGGATGLVELVTCALPSRGPGGTAASLPAQGGIESLWGFGDGGSCVLRTCVQLGPEGIRSFFVQLLQSPF